MKYFFVLALGLVVCSFAFGADFSVKPYTEPASMQAFRAAADTVTSAESQKAVAQEYQTKYPDEIAVQMFATNLLMAEDITPVRKFYKDRADGSPDNLAAQFLAGRLMEAPDVRRGYADKILSKDANSYWGYLLKATAYTDADDPGMKKAEADLRKAISIDNSLPFAVEQLGNLLQKRGETQAADQVYTKLSEMQPNRFAPLQYRLMLLGDNHKKAIELIEAYLVNNPKDLAALNSKARSQREISDWNGYVETNRRCIAAELNGETAYNLACAFSLNGNKDSAFVWLNSASDRGFTDLDQYKADDDLIPLRNDPRWSELLLRVDQNQKAAMAEYMKQAAANAPKRKEKAVAERSDQSAPDWSLEDFSGKQIALADLKGKVVILDFWATWCGPCRKTMPLLDKFYTDQKPEGVVVFGINVWERATRDKVKEFIKTAGFHFPILFGTNDIATAYGVSGIPTLFVIDKQGKIAYRHVGYNPTIPELLDWQTKELLK